MRLLHLACVASLASAAYAAVCVPLLECKELLENDPVANPLSTDLFCKLSDGSEGVLCESRTIGNRFGGFSGDAQASPGFAPPPNVIAVEPLKKKFQDQQTLTVSDRAPANSVVQTAKRKLAEVDRVVQELSAGDLNAAQFRSPEELQLAFSRPQSSLAEVQARISLESVQVLTDLKEQNALGSTPFSTQSGFFGFDLQNRANFPAAQDVPGSDKIPGCEIPAAPDCTGTDKFRTHNGQCNSKNKPRLGMALTAFSRFFPAEYEDGIWEPRKSQRNSDLPSARLVSERVVNTTPNDDDFRTLTVMQIGQFINHDMIQTPAFRRGDGRGLSCCNRGNTFPDEPLHPTGCNPIRVPDNDPFYSKFGRTCMNQVRSLPAPFEDCVAGPTSQLNGVSQFLDMSNTYGSSDETSDQLRSRSGGRIKTSRGNLLPEGRNGFFSGEGRLSENPGLAFMHTIWTREHNRVADELARLNPRWGDERLYQEARRITNAEYQHIIYNEYVPTVLGFKYTREHALNPGNGFSFSFNDSVDPRITSEFSTAAFRFGHSQVHDAWVLRDETGRILETLRMEDTFFKTNLLKKPGFMKQITRSLIKQKNGAVDASFSPSVHEKLFAQRAPSGLDLIALNIQRGRDHGLPTYITALENCIEREIQGGWEGLKEFFEPQVLNALRNTYESIFDIDIFIGGVAEKRKPGALVGEVFQCIIGEQFFALRYGDRFFYDNGDLPNSFLENQLREIQQASWARILCDNIEDLESVQPLAMWQPSVFFNRQRPCDSLAIPQVDLNAFKEEEE